MGACEVREHARSVAGISIGLIGGSPSIAPECPPIGAPGSGLCSPEVDTQNLEFVGRRAEIEQLRGGLDALDGASGRFVAVTGAAGIGKARFRAELRLLAEERGYPVLRSAAADFETDVPFALWADAL